MIDPTVLKRLESISRQHCLLPVGWGQSRKAPMLSGWTTHPGFSVSEVSSHPGVVACGVRCDQLWCVDFDGASAIERSRQLGLHPEGVSTWRVQRDTDLSRFKLLFAPSPAQVDQAIDQGLTAGHFHFNESTGAGEQLEQFFSPGRQVIVLGKHWSSGGHYYWPDSSGPEALSAPPNFWWDTVLQLALDNQQTSVPKHRTVSTGRGDWHRLDDCPVCHRRSNPVCQLHRDGRTLRCYRGATYGPPLDLQKGQLAPGTQWAFSKTQQVDFGTFSVFALHQPSHHQRLRSMLRNG